MNQKKALRGKPLFSLFEIYGIAVRAFCSMGDLMKSRKTGLVTEALQERIMLAVTAVNQCAMCSYAHAGMALEAGLSEEEIRVFTEGDFPDLPEDEARAVLFGQHYADQRGRPSKEAWQALTDYYGEGKALGILAAARVIMLGNAVGIVLTSLRGRARKEGGVPRSCLLYEIGVLLFLIPALPVALLHGLLARLFGRRFLRFS